MNQRIASLFALCFFSLFPAAFAQRAPLATLKGVITDESGALVPGAKVTATDAAGVAKAAISGTDGSYALTGLPAGQYTVEAASPGMAQSQATVMSLNDGVATANITMRVAEFKQEITVQESSGPQVSTDPSQNADALVMRGDDLQALSDDPDDMQSDLEALAGPAAGPNGGQIYVDGFTAGDSALPSKDAIREIRVN